MRRSRSALLFALVFLLPAGSALADVTVRYDSVRTVSSLVYRSVAERDSLFGEIARLLKSLGDRQLPPGRSLAVELLDIRPAGEFRPYSARASDVRVVSDVTPPRVRLRYALKERGQVIAQGEETVTDLNFLWNASARTSLSSFPYERELMRDWFRDRIVRLKPPLR